MITKIAASGVVALLLLSAAPAAMAESQQQKPATTQSKTSATGPSFVKKAIEGNLAEVQMGKLAQQKGQDDDVKEFGETLVEDHGKAAEKAKELAKESGVTVPTEPSAEHKKAHDELSKLSGAQFDRQFVQVMIREHKKDIQAYTAAAEGDGPIADYAEETLPKLRDHLEKAEEIAKDLGSEKRSEKK